MIISRMLFSFRFIDFLLCPFRDALRLENADLKQKQGFIGSDLLVIDFETRKVLPTESVVV